MTKSRACLRRKHTDIFNFLRHAHSTAKIWWDCSALTNMADDLPATGGKAWWCGYMRHNIIIGDEIETRDVLWVCMCVLGVSITSWPNLLVMRHAFILREIWAKFRPKALTKPPRTKLWIQRVEWTHTNAYIHTHKHTYTSNANSCLLDVIYNLW